MLKTLLHSILVVSAMLIFIAGCGDSFDAMKDDVRVQTFNLSGIEVHYRVAYAAPPDTFSIDTIEVAYSVDVELPKEKPDSLRFFGLPGAKKAYHAHGLGEDYRLCSSPSRTYCDLYARYYKDNTFEMYLVSPSGMYTADGKLENGKLELEGNFFYRGTSIDYFLTGQDVNR